MWNPFKKKILIPSPVVPNNTLTSKSYLPQSQFNTITQWSAQVQGISALSAVQAQQQLQAQNYSLVAINGSSGAGLGSTSGGMAYYAQQLQMNPSQPYFYDLYQDKKKLEHYLEPLSLFARAEFFLNLKYYVPYLGYNTAQDEWNKWNKILEKKKHNDDFNTDLKAMLDE